MNWDEIKGDWKQVSGKIRSKWGKLTDDDLTQIDGKREELAGRIKNAMDRRRKRSSAISMTSYAPRKALDARRRPYKIVCRRASSTRQD